MKPYRPAIRAARRRVRAARAQVVDDIAAPVVDKARLEGDLAALRRAVQDQQASQHAGLAAAVLALSPASRATLAERVEGKRASAPAEGGVGKGPGDRSDGYGLSK
jgi:Spy/CpxP family protein refolding chaperone